MRIVANRISDQTSNRSLRIAVLADAAHVNCQRWCEGLYAAGADVHMISFSNWTSKVIPVHRLQVRRLPGKVHYFLAAPQARRLIASIRPDVLLAYYVTGYGTLGVLAGFHPLVHVTSGSDVLVAPHNSIMKSLLRITLRRGDLVTAWESHMAEAAGLLGVPKSRLFVIPRGIPYGEFVRHHLSEPTSDGPLAIISTRSLNVAYNIDKLIEATNVLNRDGVNCSLTIAGDGPSRERIVRFADQLGLGKKIRFAGFVPNDQLSTVLSQHHIYVSLIESDGVSASLLEAMAVGLLPIVPDHTGNRCWIKDGVNGLLLNDLSPNGVAQCLARAMSDLPLRKRAWEMNSEIVRDRADLYRNSKVFVEKFRELVQQRSDNQQPLQ